jgi:hypothetical protein
MWTWRPAFDVSENPGLGSVETMSTSAWRLGFQNLDSVDVDVTKRVQRIYVAEIRRGGLDVEALSLESKAWIPWK